MFKDFDFFKSNAEEKTVFHGQVGLWTEIQIKLHQKGAGDWWIFMVSFLCY